MTRAHVRSVNGRLIPEWTGVVTYSPEWYRRFRVWWLRRYPGTDRVTRANLTMLQQARTPAEGEK